MNIQIKNIIKKILPGSLWNFLRHYSAIIPDRLVNFGSSVCHIDYCGFNLCYAPGTILIKKIRNGKIFEEKMCSSIVNELEKSDDLVFLDIGANIGLISLYVASKISPIKIYAFEPGPSQNKQFKRTIEENDLEKSIILSSKALGEREGTVGFITHFSPDASGDGFIDTGRAGQPIPIEVEVTTIDKWWHCLNKPIISVVKIDTEGSELQVLKGAVNFLKVSKPVIYLEIEPKNLRVYPYTRDDILKWLNGHDYSVFTLDNDLCTLENFGSFIGRYDTYIAKPTH